MKRFALLFFVLLSTLGAYAQKGKVTASLIDRQTRMGIAGAVIELSPAANPDAKRYYTSAYNGAVSISSVAYGEYNMKLSFLGYDDRTLNFTLDASSLDLGTIEMMESTTKIETVVKEVASIRTSQKGDTVSYNAGAFKVSDDASVEGLLKKMPGITVNNGSVEAQGETVQKVFVDGKEFFGEDVQSAISSLPAESVDRIEVYNKLSDNAEFSGMDDGEGYKALNIVTKPGMRQGQFGKLYAGYGYEPAGSESKHKYIAGGNVNIFQGSSRVSIIGLFNNVNQQNFSFEDILGVTGGGGGGRPGRGVGAYMVQPQSGVANVNSLGVNYSDTYGKREQVTFEGSYFFNYTNTVNHSRLEKWYYAPSPVDTLMQNGYSKTINHNHRLNAKVEWKISDNHSLMSRTAFSYQGNDPLSGTAGKQWGQSGFSRTDDYSKSSRDGYFFREFLQYRSKLGKDGRTLTVDGNLRYYDSEYLKRSHSNIADALLYDTDDPEAKDDAEAEYKKTLRYLYSLQPSQTYNVRANATYTEPVAKYAQVSLQYRFSMEHQKSDKRVYETGSDYSIEGLMPDAALSNDLTSTYFRHQAGPGFRFSKNRNTLVANVYYQYSQLLGQSNHKIPSKSFHDVTYFLMGNLHIDRANSLRLFVRSSTDNPSVAQLQDITDVSNAQNVTAGNADLRPSYTHSVRFHYVNSNAEKGRTFMWMFTMENTSNYITQNIMYNPSTDVTGLDYVPLQYARYENINGYWSLRTHLSYGLPLNFMKCNLNLMGGVNYQRIPTLVDNVRNNVNSMGYDLSVVLGSNISEKVDFTVSWNGTFNDDTNAFTRNGVRTVNRNQYLYHITSADLKVTFWKGFTFTGSCAYAQNIGFTNKYDDNYVLCNLYIGKKIFKNQRGEILIGVNDVFNQNKAFSRTTGSGYAQNAWNSVIGRYYTVQFNFNLRHFGKKGSTNMADYTTSPSGNMAPMGGRAPMGPPPGGRR